MPITITSPRTLTLTRARAVYVYRNLNLANNLTHPSSRTRCALVLIVRVRARLLNTQYSVRDTRDSIRIERYALCIAHYSYSYD